MNLKVKRVNEKKSEMDGFRILVDKQWLRGFKKPEAKVDLLLIEISPGISAEERYHK